MLQTIHRQHILVSLKGFINNLFFFLKFSAHKCVCLYLFSNKPAAGHTQPVHLTSIPICIAKGFPMKVLFGYLKKSKMFKSWAEVAVENIFLL